MEIKIIQCLNDNYSYLLYDRSSETVAIIDPSEFLVCDRIIDKNFKKLDFILNTHHHFDHVGGNIELKKLYNAEVVGYAADKHRIPGISIFLNNNEKWTFGNSLVKILHIPGHTLGHICFFFEKEEIAFTGDTLFSLGCGRIFEGDHKQMLTSLNKIKKLPKTTQIYCGHEYTYKNAEFCIKHDLNNIDLKKKFEEIKKLRSKNLPTVPTILKDELKANIFLRCDQNDVKIKLNMKNQEDYKVFKKVRDLKDSF